MHSLLPAERKRCICLSRGGKGFWGRVSVWRLDTPLLRQVPILLLVRGLLRNHYFCIYLFYFFHIIVLFHFSLLLHLSIFSPYYILIYYSITTKLLYLRNHHWTSSTLFKSFVLSSGWHLNTLKSSYWNFWNECQAVQHAVSKFFAECHCTAYIINNAQLSLICCTVDKT